MGHGALTCKDQTEEKNHVKYAYLGVDKNDVCKLVKNVTQVIIGDSVVNNPPAKPGI